MLSEAHLRGLVPLDLGAIRQDIYAVGAEKDHIVPWDAASPEERAMLLETLFEIDRLLSGLPTAVKRAFLLSQLDGMEQADIAAQLRVSVTTVKRYLVRAATQCYFAVAPE